MFKITIETNSELVKKAGKSVKNLFQLLGLSKWIDYDKLAKIVDHNDGSSELYHQESGLSIKDVQKTDDSIQASISIKDGPIETVFNWIDNNADLIVALLTSVKTGYHIGASLAKSSKAAIDDVFKKFSDDWNKDHPKEETAKTESEATPVSKE